MVAQARGIRRNIPGELAPPGRSPPPTKARRDYATHRHFRDTEGGPVSGLPDSNNACSGKLLRRSSALAYSAVARVSRSASTTSLRVQRWVENADSGHPSSVTEHDTPAVPLGIDHLVARLEADAVFLAVGRVAATALFF